MFKVYFITFGCKLNQSETNIYQEKLADFGAQMVTNFKIADLIIINSCAVTVKAEREARQKINQFRRENLRAKIIMTGCSTAKKFLGVNFIPCEKLINYLAKRVVIKKKVSAPSFRARAFVKIQDGCNNFCAYCIVPYLRGRIISRSVSEIIDEIKKTEEQGGQEIVLVGTDLQRFGDKKKNLVFLLKQILSKTKINRIRISSLWPTAINQSLIDLFKKNNRLCPHFHLSMQSGSNLILKRMGRSYKLRQVLDLIKRVKAIKNLSLTADLIVGFPGETENDFGQTVNFVKQAKLLKVHIFRYSPRPGTRAAKMLNQISDRTKKERSQKLFQISQIVAKKAKKSYFDKQLMVLFEAKRDGYWSGFSDNYLKVYLKSQKDLTNSIVKIQTNKVFKDGLTGKALRG